MLYMIIEGFKNCDAAPVYRRFRDHGRLAPEGLKYVSSRESQQPGAWPDVFATTARASEQFREDDLGGGER